MGNLYSDYKNGNTSYRVEICDMFKVKDKDGICITTNGYINKKGCNVMGAGVALQAKITYPYIDRVLGKLLKYDGNRVYLLKVTNNTYVFNIPTKPSIGTLDDLLPQYRDRYKTSSNIPGYTVKSNIILIEKTLQEITTLVDIYGLSNVYIPLLGCSNGGLGLTDILELLNSNLNNNFVLCSRYVDDFNY